MNQAKDLRAEIIRRAEANRKKHLAQGVYTAEDERRIVGLALDHYDTARSIMARLEAYQAEVAAACPKRLLRFASPDPGSNGAVNLLKRLARFLARVITPRRRVFAYRLVELTDQFLDAHRRTLAEIAALRKETTEALVRLERRLDWLDREHLRRLNRLEARLARPAGETGRSQAPSVPVAPAGEAPSEDGLAGADYLAFEDRFRGPAELIKAKQRPYVELLRDAPGLVLDLGCGRGEFLELLAENHILAAGVDINPEMIDLARAKGLRAETADGLDYLKGLEDASLGGVFMSQVIEHLTLARLTELLAEAHRVLASGGLIIAETVNPGSLSTFARAFYKDPTHLKPIHPEAARFLVERAGFVEVEIRPMNPYPDQDKLLPVDDELPGAETINHNLALLNDLIFAAQDYAVVGRKR